MCSALKAGGKEDKIKVGPLIRCLRYATRLELKLCAIIGDERTTGGVDKFNYEAH